MDGWSATEPAVGGVPGLGFVAMSFDESLSSAYNEGMKPAVETDCGLQLIRVDAGHFQEKICDRIIAEIRRSQFVIADFTKQRGGVYFEAGFALALGRIVIWTCREDDISNVHFDTRQYPHLVWSTPGDLRVKLADRVRALVPGAQA
jgi:nucleoside 2-deoxyribosyltransferase